MSKLGYLFFSLIIFSTHSLAFEPELQQQGMVYFNISFDAGHSKKTEHHFGFRLDQGMVKPGETMMLSRLISKPAAFDIQYNNNGLKAFKLHGVDYTEEVIVTRGAEAGTEEPVAADPEAGAESEAAPAPEEEVVEATPRRKINIPLGVVIGGLIGFVAIAGSGQ